MPSVVSNSGSKAAIMTSPIVTLIDDSLLPQPYILESAVIGLPSYGTNLLKILDILFTLGTSEDQNIRAR